MSTIRFCPECNNMLYPKEDKGQSILQFACRNCDHQEDSTHHCVYKNSIITQALETTSAVPGLSADPTLPRTTRRPCPRCGHKEAVFFQSHDRRRDTPMTLYFVCCAKTCGHLWSDERQPSKDDT